MLRWYNLSWKWQLKRWQFQIKSNFYNIFNTKNIDKKDFGIKNKVFFYEKSFMENWKQYFDYQKLIAKIWYDMTKQKILDNKKDIIRIFSEDWFESYEYKKIFILDILVQAWWEISWQQMYEKSNYSKLHLNFVLNQLLKQGLIKIFVRWNIIEKVQLNWEKNFYKKYKFSKPKFWKPIFVPNK